MDKILYESLEESNKSYEISELLYTYLNNVRCFKNNDFIFTSEYKIQNKNINKNLNDILLIEKNKTPVPKNFFGKNISNINLVVGKNGSGKSTLLSLLGDSYGSRHLNYKANQTGWFSIYKTNCKDTFYIEGYNLSYLNMYSKYSNTENASNSENSKEYRLLYNNKIKKFYKTNNNNKYPSIVCIDRTIDNNYAIKKDMQNPFLEYKKYITPKYTMPINIVNNNSYEKLFRYLYKNEEYNDIINRDDFKLTLDISFSSSDYEDFKNILNNLGIEMPLNLSVNDYFESEKLLDIKSDRKTFNHTLFILIINYMYKNLPQLGKKIIYSNPEKLGEINYNYKQKLTMDILFDQLYKYFSSIYSEYYHLNINEYTLDKLCDCLDKFINSLFSLPHANIGNNNLKVIYTYIFNICFNKEKNFDKICVFLEQFDELKNLFENLTNKRFDIFQILFGGTISDGEQQSILSKTNLFEALKNSNNTHNIILIDEPDKGYHPNWISKFINDVVNLVHCNSNDKNYQFIITTHSPFMLSDIPKEFITKIDIDNDENVSSTRIVTKAEKSFACNYYDIIKDSFFLDYTIGDFAYNRIKNIQKILINQKFSKEKTFFELAQVLNIDINKKNMTSQCFNEIESTLLYFIDIIGEPLIKMQLYNLWNESKRKWANNTSDFVKALTTEEKAKLFNELKKDLNK